MTKKQRYQLDDVIDEAWENLIELSEGEGWREENYKRRLTKRIGDLDCDCCEECVNYDKPEPPEVD